MYYIYTLVIGRGFPEIETGMHGTFEFEQAIALNKFGIKSIYTFCDMRSLKLLRRIKKIELKKAGINSYGWELPIGGIPRPIFDKTKTILFKRTINKIIRENGLPDIIHVHYPLINLNEDLWNFLKSFDKPIVVTEHWSKVQKKVIETNRLKLLKLIVREANHVICVGEYLKESIKELTNAKQEISVIPNMLNSVFNNPNLEINPLKGNKFTFVSIGRLVETKNMSTLIKAFSQLSKLDLELNLKIVGDGPQYQELKKEIESLGLEKSVELLGFKSRKEIMCILLNSHAYVSASEIETFGVPYIEAMACGRPVIAPKGGVLDKFIEDNQGILYEDFEGLVGSLLNIIENIDKVNNSEVSRKTITAFNDEAIVLKLQSIYQSII